MRDGRFVEARDLFTGLSTAESLEEFLTLPAYELVHTMETIPPAGGTKS
jgi:hypothetical protein